MIGGAELEPESAMYNPHAFDLPTIHAAISERQKLAAQHRNQANDAAFLHTESARQNTHKQATLAGIKCRKHDAEMKVNGGFGEQPPAPADCPNCKRAQTKYRNSPARTMFLDGHPGGRKGNSMDPVGAQDVAQQHHSYAEHFERSAKLLQQHVRTRTAGLN